MAYTLSLLLHGLYFFETQKKPGGDFWSKVAENTPSIMNSTEGELSAHHTRTHSAAERHVWWKCNPLRQRDDHAGDVQERWREQLAVDQRLEVH